MSIGSKIADRRKELGMTQQDLAEKLDVSFQAVSSWEREEYLPETERLIEIAEALRTKLSWMLDEDDADTPSWVLSDELFDDEHMERKILDYARAKGMKQTLKAVKLMNKYHKGQFRKGSGRIPYRVHPLMMACHAFALDIYDDDIISVCLLHDVLEDTDAEMEDLAMNPEVEEALELLTFKEREGLTREESRKIYFKEIADNKLASIVKVLDRCSNVSTMASGFTKVRMAEYIDETEKYVFPLIENIKREYDEYYNAAFILKYQIKSITETIKHLL